MTMTVEHKIVAWQHSKRSTELLLALIAALSEKCCQVLHCAHLAKSLKPFKQTLFLRSSAHIQNSKYCPYTNLITQHEGTQQNFILELKLKLKLNYLL